MKDRESAILMYAALGIEEMSGVSQTRLEEIQTEKREIERELGLSSNEIIIEASKLTTR